MYLYVLRTSLRCKGLAVKLRTVLWAQDEIFLYLTCKNSLVLQLAKLSYMYTVHVWSHLFLTFPPVELLFHFCMAGREPVSTFFPHMGSACAHCLLDMSVKGASACSVAVKGAVTKAPSACGKQGMRPRSMQRAQWLICSWIVTSWLVLFLLTGFK